MRTFRKDHVVTWAALVAMALLAAACSATGDHSQAAVSKAKVASSTTTTAIKATQVILFNPFAGSGPGPGIVVTFHSTAQCFPGSEGDDSRADAYRCFLDHAEPNGGNIADPCFVSPFNPSAPLLCFESPVDLQAVQVVPDSPLKPNTVNPNADPWTLQLADGQTCVFEQGASATLGNMRLNYGCPQGVIYGDPNRSSQPWTVFYQANGSNNLVQTGVSVAYS